DVHSRADIYHLSLHDALPIWLVTDTLSDLLLTPSEDANENLRREGIPEQRMKLVGNIMIDALLDNVGKARQRDLVNGLGLKEKPDRKSTRLNSSHLGISYAVF